VIPFLGHEDPYLHLAAASALQAMPGEATLVALRGALGSPSFELRGMAAVSLSHLGDPAGVEVLRDLVDPEVYLAIRRDEPRKYADARLIQHNRVLGVQGLARLGLPEDLPLLERIADGDEDLTVREAALRVLRDREAKASGD
jgi:HEAT repeat protein